MNLPRGHIVMKRITRCYTYLSHSRTCLNIPRYKSYPEFCTDIPILYINLDSATERAGVIERMFRQCPRNKLKRFSAVSRRSFIKRGPISASLRARQSHPPPDASSNVTVDNVGENAPVDELFATQDYINSHGVSVGEASLVVSHALALHEHFSAEGSADLLLVLEDDANPALLALSPVFASLRNATRQLFEESDLEGLFLQRLILPHQNPVLKSKDYPRHQLGTVQGADFPERPVWKNDTCAEGLQEARFHASVKAYPTTFGFAGSAAMLWTRQGANRFMARHLDGTHIDGVDNHKVSVHKREDRVLEDLKRRAKLSLTKSESGLDSGAYWRANVTFGCPGKGSSCALDMDLHGQKFLGSVFPPLMTGRLRVGDSALRNEADRKVAQDVLVHLQSFVAATAAAVMSFETLHLAMALKMVEWDDALTLAAPPFLWSGDLAEQKSDLHFFNLSLTTSICVGLLVVIVMTGLWILRRRRQKNE